jgi:hypothetical protein
MKRIALLSFHDAANYGASLQAYALEKFLNDNDYHSEYINYVNHHRRTAYSMSHQILNSLKAGNWKSAFFYLLGTPFLELRKMRFKKFYREYLFVTNKVYTTSEEAELLNTEYDKFIVGSDQVWNLENNGEDFAYLLDFVYDSCKKIAYSSSFGISEIPHKYVEKYKKYLTDIKYLSTREQSGCDLIKQLTGRDAKLVLDPVFLLNKEQWLSFVKRKFHQSPYIFVYTNKNKQFDDFLLNTHFNIGKRKIYILSRYTKLLDFFNPQVRVKYTMSPIDFINTINNADLVVSASFHCISLSIILNRPFVAILTGDKGKDSRLLSLLTILGLEDRIFTTQMNNELVARKIDFQKVNREIEKLKKESVDFLKSSINR